ncbi:hypothetical protein D3C83_133290 [compost metagenome]
MVSLPAEPDAPLMKMSSPEGPVANDVALPPLVVTVLAVKVNVSTTPVPLNDTFASR